MRAYEIEFNGDRIRYFDAYDINHLELFNQAQKEGRLCVIAGPTGYGKTTFFDFACASFLDSKSHNIMAYGRRYGAEKPYASAERVLNIAKSLNPKEHFAVAFYPKSANIAQVTNGDTWNETKEAIEHLFEGLANQDTLSRLVGLEFSIELEFEDIYEAVRQLAKERNWLLLEFSKWSAETQGAYMKFLMGL